MLLLNKPIDKISFADVVTFCEEIIIEGTQIEPERQTNILLDTNVFEKIGIKSAEIDDDIVNANPNNIDVVINNRIENANVISYLRENQNEINKKLFCPLNSINGLDI